MIWFDEIVNDQRSYPSHNNPAFGFQEDSLSGYLCAPVKPFGRVSVWILLELVWVTRLLSGVGFPRHASTTRKVGCKYVVKRYEG